MKREIVLGLMSGTSGDGISIAAGRFHNDSFECLGYKTYAYPIKLSTQLQAPSSLSLPQASSLHFLLGKLFAQKSGEFLKASRIPQKHLFGAGSHGHTFYHGPRDSSPNTLQLGEPSFLAEALNIPVVSDFRSKDIALGGEGAPLIPFFDQFFFGTSHPVALQNIGGISNVTYTGKKVPLIAFDNGPGNCLMDLAIQKFSKGKETYDHNGHCAAKGKILFSLVTDMLKHQYFSRKPPKSTGREFFNASFIPSALWKEKKEDILATLTFFTAKAIVQSYHQFIPKPPSRILVSGGGSRNKTLMSHLKHLLSPIPVLPFEILGLDSQAKEPLAFAFFAWQTLRRRINHAPQATGASKASILGKVTYASS